MMIANSSGLALLTHHDLWMILQRLCQIGGLDVFASGQICNRALSYRKVLNKAFGNLS
jgi:hypothetical protein